jgi:hypothetical protein
MMTKNYKPAFRPSFPAPSQARWSRAPTLPALKSESSQSTMNATTTSLNSQA